MAPSPQVLEPPQNTGRFTFSVQLMTESSDAFRDNTWKSLKIDQLTHEMALALKALPRTEVRHAPASTVCAYGCSLTRIG